MFDTTRLFGNRAKASLSPWTVAAYFLAVILFFLLVEAIIRNNTHIKEMAVERLLLEKTTAIQETVAKYVYKTHTLAALVVQKEADYNFEDVAAAVLDSDIIQNITIAPDGIISQVYPREGNEAALGLDYSLDGPGNREAILAREMNDIVMAGPFPLVQGGLGLVGRLPVWREDASGNRHYWGIVSIALKYPEILEAAGLDNIAATGLEYELWRVNPDDGTMQTIAGTHNIGRDHSYIERTLSLYSSDWHLRIGPTYLWYKDPINWALMAVGLLGSFLIASLVQSNHALTLVKGNMEFQEKALRQAVIKAQEASRMKSTFLATMSHEIRTPMNGIVGYSELAMDHVGTDTETRNYLLKIKDSAQGLLGIINDILDISKIETGHLELECIAFSLDDVLRICQTISNPKAMEKGIELRFPADILEHPIKGDPTKLRQAVLNLVANAIKFTHDGSVTVAVTTVAETDTETTLRFSVADTGIGMNEEQVQHIFVPFSQADSGITRKYGGTGLGLAITKSIVDSMGGTLEVTSEPNKGSDFHFTITFPNASPEELPEMEQKCQVRRPLFRGEVLVAEDNAINQDVIQEHLSRVGLKTVIAETGAVALERVRERELIGKPFDLILMDIHMPVMDGVVATGQIRHLDVTTPIVALTANVMTTDQEKYKEAGMSSCLGKPFTARELWDCLLQYLTPVGEADDPSTVEVVQAELEPEAAPAPATAINRPLGMQRSSGNQELYQKILRNFVRNNRTFMDSFRSALAVNDITLAFRLVHTLKGVANLIGAERLGCEALALEDALRDGRDKHTPEQMESLRTELHRVFDEIGPVPDDTVVMRRPTRLLDRRHAVIVLEKLEPLLAKGDVESLELLPEVREVLEPLGEDYDDLLNKIEEYEFEAAAAKVAELRRMLG